MNEEEAMRFENVQIVGVNKDRSLITDDGLAKVTFLLYPAAPAGWREHLQGAIDSTDPAMDRLRVSGNTLILKETTPEKVGEHTERVVHLVDIANQRYRKANSRRLRAQERLDQAMEELDIPFTPAPGDTEQPE